MNSADAWLLDFGGGRLAAVGLREVLHVAYSPEIAVIPLTPPHCSRVVVVEERILAAWDVAAWLGTATPGHGSTLAAIIGYQKGAQAAIQFGALLISAAPVRIMVSDTDACDLPVKPTRWRAIAMSCVKYREEPVPILDLRLMFSDAFSARRLRAESITERIAEII